MKKIIAVFLMITVLFSVCSCEIGKKDGTGNQASEKNFDGTAVIASTDNFSFSFAEFDYIFCDSYNTTLYNYYNAFQDDYADYILAYTGLDISKSLKSQTMNDGSGTFFDYYVNVAVEKATDILIFCEYAKANSIELGKDENDYIDGVVNTYVEQAKSNSCTVGDLFEDSMGLITEEVIRSYCEKNTLAGLGYTHLKNTYSFTDDEIDTEFKSNLKAYSYIEYLVYSFKADENAGISAENAKSYAEGLKNTSSTEDFLSYCKNYHDNVLYGSIDSQPEFSSEDILKKRVSYKDGTDYLDNLFEASEGDTFLTESTDDGITTYNVYMLAKEPAETPYNKVNVRHILFKPSNYESNDACKKAAEAVYALYKQNPTEDNFSSLANKYSEDTYTADDGTVKITDEGGLIEDIGYDETDKDFENWALNSSRKVGDTDIILSSVGYHIMYFSAFGEEKNPGHEAAENALTEAQYKKDHDKLISDYKITADTDYLQNLDY